MSRQEEDALVAQDIGATLAILIQTFAIPVEDPKILQALLERLVKEQRVVRETLLPAMTGEAASTPGKIGLKLWSRGQQDASVQVLVDKNWKSAEGDIRRAFEFAGYLAFLLFPAARGLTRLMGVDYQFIEAKPKDGPKLTLTGE